MLFGIVPNKHCGRAMRITPMRLMTMNENYLVSINYSDWPRVYPDNSSCNANGSCRKIALSSAVNIDDKNCRTVDRSKFLGMDALDESSGMKEPWILRDAMSSVPRAYGNLFPASLIMLVTQRSLSTRSSCNSAATQAPISISTSLSLFIHTLASALYRADRCASDRNAPYVDVRHGQQRQVPGEC